MQPSPDPHPDPHPDPLHGPGASYGTWISPRKQYVAHGACSWESWVLTTLVTPAFWTFVPLIRCTTHLYLCTTRRPLFYLSNSEFGPYGGSSDHPMYNTP
eukprot:1177453-Prorocentrum_minimum.AAC.3